MKDICVISMPDCSKCDEIKAFLKENDISFTEKTLDSEIQTVLVMMNVYFNPPILNIGDKYYSYKDFKNSSNKILDEINTPDPDEEPVCCQR